MKIIFLLALALGTFAATCDNPLYQVMYEYLHINPPTAPASHPDFPICTDLNGKDSCCTIEMMNAINQAWTSVKLAVNVTQQGIIQAFQQLLILLPLRPPEVDTALNAMITAFFQSQDYMFAHVAGQLCYLCSSDWAKYWDDAMTQMQFATQTCDSMYDGFKIFLESVDNFISAVFQAWRVPVPATKLFCSNDDACKAFLCGTMISRVGIFMNLTPPSFLNAELKVEAPATNLAPTISFTETGFDSVAEGRRSGLPGTAPPTPGDATKTVMSILAPLLGLAMLA